MSVQKILKSCLAVFSFFVSTSPAWACSICFKDPGSPMTIGLKQAVIVMLGALLLIFGAVFKFVWSFRKRSQTLAQQEKGVP